MAIFYLALALSWPLGLFAQGVKLKPSIGQFQAPHPSDSVCPIVPVTQQPHSWFKTGDTVADFTLYDSSYSAWNLKNVLDSLGKPVLLVTVSYTCPIARERLTFINQVAQTYPGRLEIFSVYTVEAHPKSPDICPYSGNVWQTYPLHPQPRTYGERVQLSTLLSRDYIMDPRVRMLVDGPCNAWWKNFTNHPNSAILIRPNGTVHTYQDWFHNKGNDIFCSLDQLLDTVSGKCDNNPAEGSFDWYFMGPEVATGTPGEELHAYGMVINNSPDAVDVTVVRVKNQVPKNWASALCITVCLAPDQDSLDFRLAPGDSALFTMYFFTDSNRQDSGRTHIRFYNKANPKETYMQRFTAKTTHTAGFGYGTGSGVRVFPNPAGSQVYVQGLAPGSRVWLIDVSGRSWLLHHTEYIPQTRTLMLPLKDKAPGLYQLVWEMAGDRGMVPLKLAHP